MNRPADTHAKCDYSMPVLLWTNWYGASRLRQALRLHDRVRATSLAEVTTGSCASSTRAVRSRWMLGLIDARTHTLPAGT